MDYFRSVQHIHNRQLVTQHVWCQDGRIREAAVIYSTVRHSSTYKLKYACSCNLFATLNGAFVTKRDICLLFIGANIEPTNKPTTL